MFSNSLQFSTCLFYVLLILSFCLSLSNTVDEKKINKAFPVSVLVIDSLIMLVVLLHLFGVKMMGDLKQFSLMIFFLVLVLSFILSLQNVSDKDQENKSLPTTVLIVNTLVILMVIVNVSMRYLK